MKSKIWEQGKKFRHSFQSPDKRQRKHRGGHRTGKEEIKAHGSNRRVRTHECGQDGELKILLMFPNLALARPGD